MSSVRTACDRASSCSLRPLLASRSRLRYSPPLNRWPSFMSLLDVRTLERLTREFRISMRRLLQDLCRELLSDHANVAEPDLPVAFFQRLSQALSLDSYSHWKVVGWIEAL